MIGNIIPPNMTDDIRSSTPQSKGMGKLPKKRNWCRLQYTLITITQLSKIQIIVAHSADRD